MLSVIYAEFVNKSIMLCVIMLSVVMLNVIMLSVVMLNVIMLSVVMLNVRVFIKRWETTEKCSTWVGSWPYPK